MATVRDYLTEKARNPREWLRREPRTTHPEILAHVRAAEASGLFYDDDVERYVNEHVGNLPPHERHHERTDPLVKQLGHEVYIARGILRDEAATAAVGNAAADGWRALDPATLTDGARLLVRFGTVYVGRETPDYGEPHEVRVRHDGGRIILLPKGARSRGFLPRTPALVKEPDA